MTYVIAGLALAAAVFYGLWQRGKATSQKERAERLSSALTQSVFDRAGDTLHHDVQVDGLKQRLADARRILDATRSDAALRAELGVLLTPPGAANTAAAGVPDDAAPGLDGSGVPTVPAGPGGVPGPKGSGGASR